MRRCSPNWSGMTTAWHIPVSSSRARNQEAAGRACTLADEAAALRALDEARRLALVFASQMRRVQEAIPELVEDEYDRRQRSGTIGGSDDMLGVLFSYLAFLQEQVGTEETRKVAWRTWAKEREARGFPAEVVGVEAPWNLFGMGIAHSELGESGFPLEGRALSPGVRRAALVLTAEPALAERGGREPSGHFPGLLIEAKRRSVPHQR